MGESTEIAWTDATFNPWIGCQEVSPGCDHCYARGLSRRFAPNLWGIGSERKFLTDAYWAEPFKWQAKAIRDRRHFKVFCASMADVFDNHEAVKDSRNHLWDLIRTTRRLDWLVLTKRIGNAKGMLPDDWGEGWPNVWLGISVVNQTEAERDVPKLLDTPATIRFLSIEPSMGSIDLAPFAKGRCVTCWGRGKLPDYRLSAIDWDHPPNLCPDCVGTGLCADNRGIDWVILGGESGPQARPLERSWAHGVRDWCVTENVPFFMKQGSQLNWRNFRDLSSFPPDLQLRQWPASRVEIWAP